MRWPRTDGEAGEFQHIQYLNPLPLSLRSAQPIPDGFIALCRIPETTTIAAIVAARVTTHTIPHDAIGNETRVGVAWELQHWDLSWNADSAQYSITQNRAPVRPPDSTLQSDRDGVDPAELVAVHLDATPHEYAIAFEASVPDQPDIRAAIATLRFNRETREMIRTLEIVPSDLPPADPE